MVFGEDSPRYSVFGTAPIQAYSEPHVAGVAQDVEAEVVLTVFNGPVPDGFTALA